MRQVFNELGTCIICALAGGLTAYCTKTPANERSALRFSVQILCALFTSFLVHNICKQIAWCAPGTNWYVVVISITGYSARPLLQVLDAKIVKKIKMFFE